MAPHLQLLLFLRNDLDVITVAEEGEHIPLDIKNDLINLLNMSDDAYQIESKEYKHVYHFLSEHGLNSRVFEYKDKVVIAFKGTTLTIFGKSLGPTAEYDKRMNHALFKKCFDGNCIADKIKFLKSKESYITEALDLIDYVKSMYPDREMILTGHSLGGAIASITGQILNTKAVSFNSPGEKYISNILNFKNDQTVLNIGMCNDPIFLGVCDGSYSSCRLAKYSIETNCHTGKVYCVPSTINFDSILFHTVYSLRKALNNTTKLLPMEETCKEDNLN